VPGVKLRAQGFRDEPPACLSCSGERTIGSLQCLLSRYRKISEDLCMKNGF